MEDMEMDDDEEGMEGMESDEDDEAMWPDI